MRTGELEATNYFFAFPDQEAEAGRTYDTGSGYGHIAIGVDDLEQTLDALKEKGSSLSGSPTASAKAAPSYVCERSRWVAVNSD